MAIIVFLIILLIFLIMNSSQKLEKQEEDPNIPSIVGIRNGNMFCTGFILDSDWVLTAARCVAAKGITMVFAGTPNIYGPDAIEVQSSLIVKHPRYNYLIEELGGHDIALVKVDLSFHLDKVKILPLSDENWPLNDHTYKRFCKIIGFGSVEGYQNKPFLHVNEVFAEHGYKACSGCTEGDQLYRLVCLKRGDDIGICGSDIGGPLICDGKAVAVAHKIFTVGQCNDSRTNIKTKCHRKETVSAFMYICPYLAWINKYVGKTPVSCGKNLLLSSANSRAELDFFAILQLFLSTIRIISHFFVL